MPLLIGYIGGVVVIMLVAHKVTSLADERGSRFLWIIGYRVLLGFFWAWIVGGVVLSVVISTTNYWKG